MNKSILLLTMACVFSVCGCAQKAGGYGEISKPTEDELVIFNEAVAEIQYLQNWEPCGVSRQVVAGTNYCFTCKNGNESGTVYIFRPLPGRGKPEVTGINDQRNVARVVIDENTHEVLGRYVSETETEYVIAVQDEVAVPKQGKVVTCFCAVEGKGVVYQNELGVVKVRKKANNVSKVIATIQCQQGEMPECYTCNGFSDGFYRITIDGKEGFVSAHKIAWNSICSF